MITKALINDSRIIFEINEGPVDSLNDQENEYLNETEKIQDDQVVSWKKTNKADLLSIKQKVIKDLQRHLNHNWIKLSNSRYESDNKDVALFIMAANFSERNNEYWYSINDENLPWFDLYKTCYLAFVLGGPEKVLLFDYRSFRSKLDSCLRTEEDISRKKKPHYHIHFASEANNIIYFKQKIPEKKFLNVSDALINFKSHKE